MKTNSNERSRFLFRFSLRDIFPILKNTFKTWMAHDPFRQSAVIAYYAIFSLPGLLVIVVAAAGFVFGREAITGQLSAQIGKMMGHDTAVQIQDLVANAAISNSSVIATIIAVVIMFTGATGVFVQLQKSLNLIWEVKPVPKKMFASFVQTRLVSFGLILSIGFLLSISLVMTSMITMMGAWLQNQMPGIAVVLLQVLNFFLSFALFVILFALMFKYLPDAKIKWGDVWLGGIVTTLLFSLGQFALGLYFGKAHPTSTYGAAGSIVLIMLWVFYSCMIFFFGAEFTRQNVDWWGKKVVPVEHAVADEDAERKIKK